MARLQDDTSNQIKKLIISNPSIDIVYTVGEMVNTLGAPREVKMIIPSLEDDGNIWFKIIAGDSYLEIARVTGRNVSAIYA